MEIFNLDCAGYKWNCEEKEHDPESTSEFGLFNGEIGSTSVTRISQSARSVFSKNLVHGARNYNLFLTFCFLSLVRVSYLILTFFWNYLH